MPAEKQSDGVAQFLRVGCNKTTERITVIDEEGLLATFRLQGDIGWEIYEEYPMNFGEALSWMSLSSDNKCMGSDSMTYVIQNNNFMVCGDDGRWFDNRNSVNELLWTKFKKVEK